MVKNYFYVEKTERNFNELFKLLLFIYIIAVDVLNYFKYNHRIGIFTLDFSWGITMILGPPKAFAFNLNL